MEIISRPEKESIETVCIERQLKMSKTKAIVQKQDKVGFCRC